MSDLIAEAQRLVSEHGSVRAASRATGIPRSTLRSRLAAAEPRTQLTRVLVIGDVHDAPGRPKDHLRWLGQLARERRVDRVVDFGDWGDWSSLSRHDGNSTISGKSKLSFNQDAISFEESLDAFREGLGEHRPALDFCLGNHEQRVGAWEDRHPETEGMMCQRVADALTSRGWEVHPYGRLVLREGVGYVHVPLDGSGKAISGQHADKRIADLSTCDLVYGHTHKAAVRRFEKIGDRASVTVVNVGTSLPHGFVPDWCEDSTTGWSYGAFVLTIHEGRIEAASQISMLDLEDQYGRRAAA